MSIFPNKSFYMYVPKVHYAPKEKTKWLKDKYKKEYEKKGSKS